MSAAPPFPAWPPSYLRAHADAAAAYAQLKRSLALKHRDDRRAYTDGKAAFVSSVLERARLEWKATPGRGS